MPNVFQNISDFLDERQIDVLINVQAGQFGTVQVSLRDFKNNAKSDLNAFIRDLGDVPLPSSAAASDLEASFQALLAAFQQEPEGLSVTFSQTTQALIDRIGDKYVTPFAAFFELYRCIDELIRSFPDLAVSASGGSTGNTDGIAGPVDLVFSTALNDKLDSVVQAFDELIAPLTGVSGLMVLAVVVSYLPRKFFSTDYLLYLDEVQQILKNLNTWANDPDSLPIWLQEVLQQLDDFLSSCFEDETLTALTDEVQTAIITINDLYFSADDEKNYNLKKDIEEITYALDQLTIEIKKEEPDRVAVQSWLAILTPDRADKLQRIIQAISTGFTESSTDEALADKLEELLLQLEEKLLDIIREFHIPDTTDLQIQWPDWFPPRDIDLELEDILAVIRQGRNGLCQLIHKLDLGTVAGDLAADAEQFSSEVASWKDQVENFKQGIEDFLDTMNKKLAGYGDDLNVLLDNFQNDLNTYSQTISSEISLFFEQLAGTIDDLGDLVEATAGSYNYDDLEADIKQFMQSVSGTLMQFSSDLAALKKRLDKIAKDIETLSFKPVSDLAVQLIEDATLKLEGIDKDKMNGGLLLGLTAAIAVIPSREELRKKMDALIAGLEELIESGPVALLERIKDKPEEILQALKDQSPVPYIRKTLQEWYEKIVGELGDLEPDLLLQPLVKQLEELQQLVVETANPCNYFDAILNLHAELTEAYETLDPGKALQFLTGQKAKLLAVFDSALSEEELTDLIDRLVIVVHLPQKLNGILEKVCLLTDSFLNNPEALVNAVLKDLSAAIDQVPMPTVIDDLIEKIKARIDRVKFKAHDNETDLVVKTDLAITIAALELVLDSEHANLGSLGGWLHAYNGLKMVHPDKIKALPQPQAGEVQEVLNNFNPLAPALEHDLSALRDLLDRIKGYDQKLKELLLDLLAPEGPIYACLPVSTTIRETLKDCVVVSIKAPVLELIEWLRPLNEFLKQLKEEIMSLIACLPDLTPLPDAVANIRQALQNFRKIVEGTNTDLPSSLLELYDIIGDNLTRLGAEEQSNSLPALKQQLCASIEQLRASLQFSALVDQEDIKVLNEAYRNILDIAEQFDPVLWAEESLKEEFERLIEPYLGDYDLTQIFHYMLDRLEELKEELRMELDHIYQEFTEMLEAVPRLTSPAEIQITI